MLERCGAFQVFSDRLAFGDHAQDRGAPPRCVIVDEPSQRTWIVNERFDRGTFKGEGLSAGRFQFVEDHDEIDVGQVCPFPRMIDPATKAKEASRYRSRTTARPIVRASDGDGHE
ncbi:hypothetical protein C725_2105 [Pacificimonas flava]|uniref:Uncharacterized protein n=1 Tax=Pacificimonas flava TaxID=1234595 RepID=M2T791_9SPHN|nr:hypothetical protein C725_2105 [Pacificimonas flava]